MKRASRILARIPSPRAPSRAIIRAPSRTITVSLTLLAVCSAWLFRLPIVSAGFTGGATGGSSGKAGLGKAPEPPAYGVTDDDDTILLADKPGKLTNVSPARRVIALDLTRDELRKEGNDQKLVDWVQSGGIVWTHTDAAAAFGFRLQPLRNPLELSGRSVAATPFNAHYFTKGVQRVYYSLKPTSTYVGANPRALMLLRNTDNPIQSGAQLFVAAYLPVGKGAVFFAPPYIHKRADGGAFLQAMKGYSTGKETLAEVPVKEVEAVGTIMQKVSRERDEAAAAPALAAARAHVAMWSALAFHRVKDKDRTKTAVDRAVAMPGAGADVHRLAAQIYDELGETALAKAESTKAGAPDKGDATSLGLMLTGEELEQAEAVFSGQAPRPADASIGSGGAVGKAVQRRSAVAAASALARVWVGRLYYQLGSNSDYLNRADQQFQAALKLDDASPEANQREAYVLATAGRNSRIASAQRAEYLLLASQLLSKGGPDSSAGASTPTGTTNTGVPPGKTPPPAKGKGKTPTPTPTPGATGGTSASSSSGNKLADQLKKEAEIAAAEPPALTMQVTRLGSILVRSFPGDSAVIALQAVSYAQRSAEQFGFHLDEVEILSFPNQAQYVRYLRLAEVPRGEFDEIAEAVDNKVLTHLQVTGGTIGKGGRLGAVNASVLSPIFGHTYGHALMGSFAEGGTIIPGWLREGLASLIEPQAKDPMPFLRAAQTQRLLFRSEDLNSQIDTLAAGDDQRRLIYTAQAHSIAQHLVRVAQNNPGILYLLVQDLGAGKSADESLRDHVGGTFDDLFNDWARKVMGVR